MISSISNSSAATYKTTSQTVIFTGILYKSGGEGVYRVDRVNKSDQIWCEQVYEAKAAALVLYGRALGLSHGEAEDVLQETFLALMQKLAPPEEPGHYCGRAFR